MASFFDFIFHIVRDAALQFLVLFGAFLAGGLALTLIARWTNNAFRQFRFPQFGLYAFGMVGVAVHEASHALFCKIFGHEIRDVKWFDAKARGGAQGSVTHLYSPWNPYHRIGQFFIGLGPAILGPAILAALFFVCVPGARELGWSLRVENLNSAASFTRKFSQAIFRESTFQSWSFYLFVYVSICITSQIELSREDLKQAMIGTLPLFLLLLVINATARALGLIASPTIVSTGWKITSLTGCLFLFSLLLSLVTLTLCTTLMSAVNLVFGRKPVNPFRD